MASARDEIGVLIDGLRASGLTPNDIVRESGVSRTVIWKHQNNRVGAPLLSTYLAVGRAYESVTGHPPPPLSFTTPRRRG